MRLSDEQFNTITKNLGLDKPVDKAYLAAQSLGLTNDENSTHTLQAVSAGADPQDLQWARQQLGKKEYQNYCQRFVRIATDGLTSGSSAIKAWESNKNQLPGLLGAKPGNPVYFSGGKYGHTGIYSGNNKFISATPWGVQENDINDWSKRTGQQLLGNIPNELQ